MIRKTSPILCDRKRSEAAKPGLLLFGTVELIQSNQYHEVGFFLHHFRVLDNLGLENLIKYKVRYAVSLVVNVFEGIEKHPFPGFENVQSKMV